MIIIIINSLLTIENLFFKQLNFKNCGVHFLFLAPTGVQEMKMFVHLSVCPMKSVVELIILIFWAQISLR